MDIKRAPLISLTIIVFVTSYTCSIVQYRVNRGEMDRQLALVWLLVFCQLLLGNADGDLYTLPSVGDL